MLRRRSYALTDVGRKRPQNEDAFIADDTLGLYVVADGVGGQAKGEVASAESVEQVRNYICSGYAAVSAFLRRGSLEDVTTPIAIVTPGADGGIEGGGAAAPAAELDEERLALRRLVASAVQSACYYVFGLAEQDPTGAGMSTTLSAVLIAGDHAIIGQVGDSRVYHLRDGRASQVTVDHTLINHQIAQGIITPEQARTARGKNVITRAVGHRDYVEVDTFEMDLLAGDRFLICSDGLHNYLHTDEVDELIGDGSVEAVARRAIELANSRGGRDNITAIVVAVA